MSRWWVITASILLAVADALSCAKPKRDKNSIFPHVTMHATFILLYIQHILKFALDKSKLDKYNSQTSSL